MPGPPPSELLDSTRRSETDESNRGSRQPSWPGIVVPPAPAASPSGGTSRFSNFDLPPGSFGGPPSNSKQRSTPQNSGGPPPHGGTRFPKFVAPQHQPFDDRPFLEDRFLDDLKTNNVAAAVYETQGIVTAPLGKGAAPPAYSSRRSSSAQQQEDLATYSSRRSSSANDAVLQRGGSAGSAAPEAEFFPEQATGSLDDLSHIEHIGGTGMSGVAEEVVSPTGSLPSPFNKTAPATVFDWGRIDLLDDSCNFGGEDSPAATPRAASSSEPPSRSTRPRGWNARAAAPAVDEIRETVEEDGRTDSRADRSLVVESEARVEERGREQGVLERGVLNADVLQDGAGGLESTKGSPALAERGADGEVEPSRSSKRGNATSSKRTEYAEATSKNMGLVVSTSSSSSKDESILLVRTSSSKDSSILLPVDTSSRRVVSADAKGDHVSEEEDLHDAASSPKTEQQHQNSLCATKASFEEAVGRTKGSSKWASPLDDEGILIPTEDSPLGGGEDGGAEDGELVAPSGQDPGRTPSRDAGSEDDRGGVAPPEKPSSAAVANDEEDFLPAPNRNEQLEQERESEQISKTTWSSSRISEKNFHPPLYRTEDSEKDRRTGDSSGTSSKTQSKNSPDPKTGEVQGSSGSFAAPSLGTGVHLQTALLVLALAFIITYDNTKRCSTADSLQHVWDNIVTFERGGDQYGGHDNGGGGSSGMVYAVGWGV